MTSSLQKRIHLFELTEYMSLKLVDKVINAWDMVRPQAQMTPLGVSFREPTTSQYGILHLVGRVIKDSSLWIGLLARKGELPIASCVSLGKNWQSNYFMVCEILSLAWIIAQIWDFQPQRF